MTDPEAIRQKRIAELERLIKEADGYAAMYSNRRDFWVNLSHQHRAELSRLRKGGDDRPKLRLEDDAQGKRAMLGGYQMPNELIPSLEAEPSSPSPEPQDVREDDEFSRLDNFPLEYQRNYYRSMYKRADEAVEYWRQQASLAQSDAQPVEWQMYLSDLYDVAIKKYKSAVDNYSEDHETALLSAIDEALFHLTKLPAPPRPDASGLIEAAEWRTEARRLRKFMEEKGWDIPYREGLWEGEIDNEFIENIYTTLKHARTFIMSRERMHPYGIAEYDALLERIDRCRQERATI